MFSSPVSVADLHCDLLFYLTCKKGRTAYDPNICCSIPEMRQGKVIFQTLAVFTETKPGSAKAAHDQFAAYNTIKDTQDVQFVLAIENASGLCEENEKLEVAITRLEQVLALSPLLYLSLTWNSENRFGGGNASTKGLKRDGEVLLELLNEKKIAIDLSHTSDALAEGILNYIDKKGLGLIPIASHSNFRKIADHPRNLPDEIAKEILKRGGIIGLNFVRAFIGKDAKDFLSHVEHAAQLGCLNNLCCGADFAHEGDFPEELNYLKPIYFADFSSASCYPKLWSLFSKRLSQEEIEAISHKNFFSFLQRTGCEALSKER